MSNPGCCPPARLCSVHSVHEVGPSLGYMPVQRDPMPSLRPHMKTVRVRRRRIPRRVTASTARRQRRARLPTQRWTPYVRSGAIGSIAPGCNASLKRDPERELILPTLIPGQAKARPPLASLLVPFGRSSLHTDTLIGVPLGGMYRLSLWST
jgi:hypothetical protein